MRSSLLFLFLLSCCSTFLFAEESDTAASEQSLVERLGFAPDARVLIINGDDFGMNQATNTGTLKALKNGVMTSSTIMACCPWFEDAVAIAKKNPKANLGVHTTLTSEWSHYKWGPVLGCSAVPNLCTDKGYFHADVFSIYAGPSLDEAELEVRAQIDKMLKAGIDVTHIDSHMGAMQYDSDYHARLIRIAASYNLPCRLPGRDLLQALGQEQLLDLAKELNVLGPEVLYMGDPDSLEGTEAWFKDRMSNIDKGKVSEMYIHCAVDTPEMHATTSSTKRRIADTEFFSDPATRRWVKEQGIELISYRELRELQRTGKAMPRVEYTGW
ncbi:MAG: ChbG/HpnK family deacetylase [Candidatus Hydrogenedentes bacterium]|nr:ChbG/HpnK family deacetylase [Candidatus Hydrogenedentota bacterium]